MDNQKKFLPLEKNIAFKHPKQGNIIIFIGGEIPHLVKKIVNVFESSDSKKGKRNLMFCGKIMSLTMLQDIYEHVQNNFCLGKLRDHMLTRDHFKTFLPTNEGLPRCSSYV